MTILDVGNSKKLLQQTSDFKVKILNNQLYKPIARQVQCEERKGGFKSCGRYCVIGGFGGVGQIIVKYLLKEYNAKIVVVGRKTLDYYNDVLQDLQKLGDIEYHVCDISKKEDLEYLFSNNLFGEKKFDGLLFMAAEYKSGFLSNYSLSEFEHEEHNMYSRYRMFFEYDISSYFSNVLIFTSIQAIHANPGSAIYAAESCFKACIHKYIRLNPRIKSYVFMYTCFKTTFGRIYCRSWVGMYSLN